MLGNERAIEAMPSLGIERCPGETSALSLLWAVLELG